jgi:ABC-2 type transport system ATP-binding protein
MTILTCNKINKHYKIGFSQRKTKQVLNDVSFSLQTNEVFGIIGPNGAGKSTILKIIMGFTLPDSGSVQIFTKPSSSPLGHKNLGYLPEHPSLYPHLSPREHLQFACDLENIRGKEATAKIEKVLEQVDLLDNIDNAVGGFSKGMTQRAALAYALLLEPELLILDEPMSGLDPLGRQLVVDIVQKCHKNGTTILFCSHILSDVERICNRIGIMNHGRLLSVTTPEELKKHPSADHLKTPLESYFLSVIKGGNH